MAATKIGAKIELDGEREYKQAIKDIAKEQSVLRSEMKLVASQFADNSKSAQALTETNGVLERQIESQKNKIELLKSALEAANTEYGEGSAQSQNWQIQLNNAQVTLNDMNRKLSENTKALDEMAGETQDTGEETDELSKALKEAETALGSAGDGADDAEKEIDELGQSMDDAGDKAVSFGDIVKANLTADAIMNGLGKVVDGLKSAGEYAIKVGSDFEASMSEVQAISGASASEIAKMAEKAKELGSNTKFSATEASQAFKYMSLAGWDTSKSISAIDGVMQLAAASGMDLAAASDMVTDYLSAFGMEADQATYMADMLAYAQANSNTTAEQLGEAYKNCAANLNAAGQDVETVTAFLEGMANQGKKSAEAGTQMSAIMRDLTAKMDDGKIAIGETSVAVMDAQGNFRDLTDIVRDVDAATQGMGDAQKASALAATFTSDSISGLNLILNEGIDKIAGYEENLRHSDGAAAAMAATMQDNLQGKITSAGSALEGLGIAAYNYFSGPVGTAVDIAASAFRGLTDLITPVKSEMQEYIDEIDAALESVQTSLDAAEATMDAATVSTDQLEYYKNKLIELNGVEEKSEYQKFQVRRIVEELSSAIPELADAYDEETGSIRLTNAEIEKLIENQKRQVMETATQKALAEVWEAQRIAEIELTVAQDGLNEAQMEWNARVNELLGPQHQLVESLQDYYEITGYTDEELEDLALSSETLNEQTERAQKAYDEASEKVEKYEAAADKIDEKLKKQAATQEDASEQTQETTETLEKLGNVAEDTAEDTEGLSEAFQRYADQTGQSVENIASSYEKLKQEYDSAYESAYNSIQGQIDLTKAHEEQEAISAASILENLASHVSAMQTYAENLKVVNAGIVDDQGNTVAALNEDFLAYLDGLGEDGANIIASISTEISAGNTQFISDLNAQWESGMTISQSVATETANAKSQFDEFCAQMDEASNQAVVDAGTAGNDAAVAYTSFQQAALALGLQDCEGEVSTYEDVVGAKKEEFSVIGADTAGAYTEHLQTGIARSAGDITGEVDGIEGTISNKTGVFGEDGEGAAGAYVDKMIGKFFGSVISVGLSLLAISGEITLFNATMKTLGGDAANNFTEKVINGLSASGPNAAEGFIGGLENSIWGSMERVRRAAQAVVDKVNATLQIHSPSRVFEASGKFSGEGYALGFEKSMEDAAKLAEIKADDFNESVLSSANDLQLRASDLRLAVTPQDNGAAEDLVNMLSTYLPIIASHKQIVLSTGVLVGELTNALNKALKAEDRREERYA